MHKITSALLTVCCLTIGFTTAHAQQVPVGDVGTMSLPDHDYLKVEITPNLFGHAAQQKAKLSWQGLNNSQKEILTRIYDVYKIHLKAVKNELNNNPAKAEKYIMSSLRAIHKLMQDYPDIKENNRFKELYRTVYTEYSSFYGIDRTRYRERGKVFALKREFLKNKGNWMKGEYVLPKSITKRETEVPLVRNKYVKNHIAFFTKGHRQIMRHWLRRSKKYFPMMKEIFKQVGVPPELVHLSMIESGLNPFARSPAAAVGMWQFIAPTARHYGLKINFWVDERRNPIKETYAAARYLRDLYEKWGNWYMALAKYNCSTYAMNRAIRYAGGVENYWQIRPYLPRETQGYVPGYIATTLIARNAKVFGFPAKFHVEPYNFVTVQVAPLMPLKKLAEAAGITLEKLKKYNPELLQWATPPGSKYTLKLPTGVKHRFLANYRKIPKNKRSKGVVVHTVKKGETLGYIAGKFGTTVRAILGSNKGLTSLIYPGQKIIIPLAPGSSQDIVAQAIDNQDNGNEVSPSSHAGKAKIIYTVKTGDTIGEIADSYDVRASQVRAWNNTSNLINPGDRLTIYVPEGRKDYYQNINGYVASSGGTGEYIVHKSDTLIGIANKFGVTVSHIKEVNNLHGSTIYPGQHLTIRSNVVDYTVRPNDTLIAIAHKFGVSVSAIQKMNNLSGSRIYVGQQLKIHAQTIDYVVKSDDTLSGIANAFGVTVQDIQQMNGLEGSLIHPGQHLRISLVN